jgi:hypothetical protein
MTTVYGEDGWWLHDGALVLGSKPDVPLTMNLAEFVILRSGFAFREDDLWKRAVQIDLTDYHRCTVASLPQDPIAEF